MMMAPTMLLLLLCLRGMLMRRLEDFCVGIHLLESETQDNSQIVCLPHLPHSIFYLTAPLLAIFVIGIIAVSPLGMVYLRLTKIAFVAIITVLFVMTGAIGALYVLYRSTDILREVLCTLLLFCIVHSPCSFCSSFFSSWLISTELNIRKTEKFLLPMLSLVSTIVFPQV
jgi:hypothetical protein